VSVNGGPWQNVARFQGMDDEGLKGIDISGLAAGQANVRVRWHYWNAYWDYFWEVDNVAILASESGSVNYALELNAPLNLLSIPLEETGIADAEALAQSIGNCTAVWRWDAAGQHWSGHPKGGANNFSVEPAGAYLVSVTASDTFECSGAWAAPAFELKAGYNLISLPHSKSHLATAEALAQDVPNCTTVWKWGSASQQWIGHIRGALDDFAVGVGDAFLVYVTADGTW
jgi:hypothetical protein